MKFNFDLDASTSRHLLTPDDIFYFKTIFKEFVEISLPEDIFNDMADIQSQFERDNRMSDKQEKYVRGVYEKYR